MLFDILGCLVRSPPFIIPHFIDSEAHSLLVAASQIIELSLFTITFTILLSERRSKLLTGAKVIKTAHSSKHSIAMRTKPTNTKTVDFILSACNVKSLNFTINSCSLKTKHNRIFKATGFVLSKCESSGF